MLSDSDLAPWPDQALPHIWLVGKLLGKQHLNSSFQEVSRCGVLRTQGLRLGPASMPIQPRGKHSGVIKYDQILRPKQFRKTLETAVLKPPSSTFQPKHARGSTV